MPLYKIGLDFGSTYSVLSYFENGKLQVFEWEPSPEKGCIPSLIAYDQDEIAIGHAARSRDHGPSS